MKLLFASSEVNPFSKTGGLADVAGALPQALRDQSVDVTVVTPLYRGIADRFAVRMSGRSVPVAMAGRTTDAPLREGVLGERVRVLFVEHPDYFDREHLYSTRDGDYIDNDERFLFFSHLVATLAVEDGYDILHLNDWQTAMAALFARSLHAFRGSTVLTIHNLGYQGVFPSHAMRFTNLGWEYFTPGRIEFWGNVNLLKGGIYFADAVTTVSPTYAKEVLTPDQGFGLDGVLRDVSDRLHGILNGIDRNEWSPETDPRILRHYTVASVTQGKKDCKRDLLHHLGLDADAKTPVIGIISRLADQKGWDIIIEALPELMRSTPAVFAILGDGERRYRDALASLRERFPSRIGLHLGFDQSLAGMIEAGADFFLMPSRYEPCGMNQMISMAYGTVPVVRAVGGLADTVADIDDDVAGCGITFRDYSARALTAAVKRALTLCERPLALARVRRSCMNSDFSWSRSAARYRALYEQLAARKDRQ